MELWAYHSHMQIDFNRLGMPTDNAIVESFNGKFREECRMPIGSNQLTMPGRRSTLGDGITMSIGLTDLSRA